jgi:hypothetical protein
MTLGIDLGELTSELVRASNGGQPGVRLTSPAAEQINRSG